MANKVIDEQEPPRPSTGDVWLLVLKDMEDRRVHGIEKYGVPVQPHNGRDPLVDAYQEALDLCVYLRQAIEERKREAEDQRIYCEYVQRMREEHNKVSNIMVDLLMSLSQTWDIDNEDDVASARRVVDEFMSEYKRK